MRRSFYFLLFLMILFPPAIGAQNEVMHFQEVKAGMKGTGKTVFSGTMVEEFQVEILGKLENVGPKQNVILAKLSGSPLNETGVLNGMSGSPVYIDGKLIGAVAFMWGFAKEPIAGITPIDEMLSMKDESIQGSKKSQTFSPSPSGDISSLFYPERLRAFFSKQGALRAAQPKIAGDLVPIGIPLIVSGFSNSLISEIGESFPGNFIAPIQAGGGTEIKSESKPKIEPGSAVGIVLVKGDINISAIGTVTAVDGDRVLAFGHPFFDIGSIDMPMSVAKVETLLPSLEASFKVAVPEGEIGTFLEDRSSGILGKIGQKSNTIPVRVEISDTHSSSSYSFDMIDHPLLTPVLFYVSLNGILSKSEKDYGDATITFKEGSLIRLSEGRSVDVQNLYSGSSTKFISTATLAYITYLLMDNEYSDAKIEGINLIINYSDSKKIARIERVWCDRSTVKPGEKISLTISLKPYRSKAITEVREIKIPEEVTPGKLTLEVGDAYMLSRMEAQEEMFVPRDLNHLIWLLNNLRTNNRVYLLFSKEDTGVLMEGMRFPNLPLSKSSVIIRPQTKGNYLVVDRRAVMEEAIDTDYAIDGLKKITLEVEEK